MYGEDTREHRAQIELFAVSQTRSPNRQTLSPHLPESWPTRLNLPPLPHSHRSNGNLHRDCYEETALMDAAHAGRGDIIRLLLRDPRVRVNEANRWGHTVGHS